MDRLHGTKKKIQGQLDIGLDDEGFRQSLKIRDALKDFKPALIFCSPLKRSQATVEPLVKEKKCAIIYSRHLLERKFGVVEGMALNEMNLKCNQKKRKLLLQTENPTYRPKGGESLKDVEKRVLMFLTLLQKQTFLNNVVCMTHGGFLNVLYKTVKQIPLNTKRDWNIPNAAFFHLEIMTKENKIIKWADTDHLNTRSVLDEN
jgi:probable phosphoglycerate mutase